jgi:hypothetical protein
MYCFYLSAFETKLSRKRAHLSKQYFSFGALSKPQKNDACGSKVHNATTNAMRVFF